MPPSDRIKPISYLTARHERRQEAAALLKMLELGERQIRESRKGTGRQDGRCPPPKALEARLSSLAAHRSIDAGSALPRDAGPHREDCPEVGVPSRPRAPSRSKVRGFARCRRAYSPAPSGTRSFGGVDWTTPSRTTQ